MSKLDDRLTPHIIDFNMRDSGGMDDANNVKLCNAEARDAIYKDLLTILSSVNRWIDSPELHNKIKDYCGIEE